MEKNPNPAIDSKEHLFEVKKMEHQPLQTDEAKQLASDYAKIINKHLNDLNDMDSKLLATAYGILNQIESYDKSQPDQNLKEGIKEAISLLEKTDSKPFVKLLSLGDLLNESKNYLYPFSRLKTNVRKCLEELCDIALGLYRVSGHYVNTNLNSTFLAWGIEPLKGRDDINFKADTE